MKASVLPQNENVFTKIFLIGVTNSHIGLLGSSSAAKFVCKPQAALTSDGEQPAPCCTEKRMAKRCGIKLDYLLLSHPTHSI